MTYIESIRIFLAPGLLLSTMVIWYRFILPLRLDSWSMMALHLMAWILVGSFIGSVKKLWQNSK